jgi:hypothetical protein
MAAPLTPSKMDVPLAPLLARVGLSEDAARTVQGCVTASEAVAKLAAAGFRPEAVTLVAHALPKREAVWWACMCARHTAPAADASLAELCAAAENWVRQQTDAARHAAFGLAQARGLDTPEAWAAVAAFWAGDSMAPPTSPKVPPEPHLCGTAVAGSVQLSAVREDPLKRQTRLAAFLDSARDIAAGGAGRLQPGG